MVLNNLIASLLVKDYDEAISFYSGNLRGFSPPPHQQMKILATPARIAAHGGLCRFHQQKARHRIALFGDVTQSPSLPTGLLQRHQPQVARHLLAALKTLRLTDNQHEPQRG